MLFEIAVVRSVPRVPLPSRRGVGNHGRADGRSIGEAAGDRTPRQPPMDIAGVRMTPQSRRTRRIARAIVRSRLSVSHRNTFRRDPANEADRERS